MRRSASRPLVLATALAGSYVLFAALSAARYPGDYGPWNDNTLSQLGNVNLNPDGYILYLIGCALAGAFAIGFFVSVGSRATGGTQNQRRLVVLLQALGIVGGFALFMNAIFPENHYGQHHFWAGVVFNSFAAAAIIAIPALWRPGGHNAVLISFDVAAFVAVILMFVFASVHWVEWVPGAMFLLFPVVLAISSHPEHTLAPRPRFPRHAGVGEQVRPEDLPSPHPQAGTRSGRGVGGEGVDGIHN
jgi:hypothetical membrane protein